MCSRAIGDDRMMTLDFSVAEIADWLVTCIPLSPLDTYFCIFILDIIFYKVMMDTGGFEPRTFHPVVQIDTH